MDGDSQQPAPQRIPKDRYVSREFLDREKERLWPRVWQVACRLEEITGIGDYVSYDVGDESIIVVRTSATEIKGYHNVCPHRGRRLMTQDCGHTNNFRCPYHAWTFSLDGRNIHVQDRDDYGDALKLADLDLMQVKVDHWGGFVFINMDPDCEPLHEFLRPLPEYLGPYEFENMRYRWYVTTVMPANWKVSLEAFMEGYHVAATHPQLLRYLGDDYTQSFALGKHSHFGYWAAKVPPGLPSPRLKGASAGDVREGITGFFEMWERELMAIWTDRDYHAAKKAMESAPVDIDVMTAFGMAVEAGRAAADEEGIGYPPDLSYEKLNRAGSDFHIFPNCVTLPWFDGTLWYRARPNGDDPDTCLFDIWSLKRYAPGQEPPLERRKVDIDAGDSVCIILDQDIANLRHVTRGMKSRAFTAARPNPVQEVEITHFHSVLDGYLD